jgi:hypothetical protein
VRKSNLFSSLAAAVAIAGIGMSAHAGSWVLPAAANTAPPPRNHLGRVKQGRLNTSTNWLRKAPHGGGSREVARRQRQLAAGTLRTN